MCIVVEFNGNFKESSLKKKTTFQAEKSSSDPKILSYVFRLRAFSKIDRQVNEKKNKLWIKKNTNKYRIFANKISKYTNKFYDVGK